MNRKFVTWFLALGLLFSAVVGYSCGTAQAQPVASISEFAGTPTSLTLVARVTPSTVGTPNGAVVDSFVWTKGTAAALVRTNVDGLTDTLVLNPRALIGKSDTVAVKVCAVYRANGNVNCSALFSKIIANADNQIPTLPVITAVDTL